MHAQTAVNHYVILFDGIFMYLGPSCALDVNECQAQLSFIFNAL